MEKRTFLWDPTFVEFGLVWVHPCEPSSGVNGKPAFRILLCLGRNDEIHKEHLSTGYWKRHYILGFLLVNTSSTQKKRTNKFEKKNILYFHFILMVHEVY